MSETYDKKTDAQKNEQERFFQMDIKNRFALRLGEAMAGEANLSFAQKCGLSEATIRKYKKGETTPNIEILESIAKVSGRTMQWFLGETLEPQEVSFQPQNLTHIEKFNVIASAGGGAYIDTEIVIELYPFSTEFLKRHRLSHADLCIIEARGDSMEPGITSGDDLLVKLMPEPSRKALEGVFVINLDNQLKVKRLEFDMVQDGYRIISDNKAHPEEFVDRDDLERMKVIGEVVLVVGAPTKCLTE